MASEDRDGVDDILEQWARERPEVDVHGMAVIGRISRLERTLRARLETVFAQHGLESWEFDVLATLLRSGPPHQLTPGRLLASSMVTSGAMTNRLKRLEGRGLIERSADPADGRQVRVSLTAEGRRLVDAALVDHAENEAALVGVLPDDERTTLVELLRRFQLGLDAVDD